MSEGTITQATAVDQQLNRMDRQRRNMKAAVKALTAERDAAIAERNRLAKEVEDVKAKSDHSALAQQNKELQAQIRIIEHRKVLDKTALAKGVRPDAVDGFYKLSEYKAEGEPSQEEIDAFVDSKKGELGYLFGKAEAATEKKEVKAVAGSGQGVKTGGTGAFQLPAESDGRWNDPMWQWKYQKEIAQAIKEKHANGEV